MGKPNGPPQMMGNPNGTPSIHHFSHPHRLELHVSNAQQEAMNVMGSCSGCKLSASGTFYLCKPCNYILHISCSQMAQKITHPADPTHTLSLLPIPAYPEGRFNCDACGLPGNGFSYHCHVCSMDIHTLCAVKPLSVNHQSHHHPLTLSFSPPYQGKSFNCDICHQVGSNHWLYRCNSCEFDAHLSCARIRPRTPPQTQTQTRPIYQQIEQRTPFAQPTQTQPIYQQTVQTQTQTRPIYQQRVQTQPIYQQTVQRPAIPHHNYGSHFTWREEGNEYGEPKEIMYGDVRADQRGDEYGYPKEVVNGDAGSDQGSYQPETIDFSGSDGGVAFDFSVTFDNTDGGYADSSGVLTRPISIGENLAGWPIWEQFSW